MSESQIQIRIKEYLALPAHRRSQQLPDFALAPPLPPHLVRALTKAQEQTV
jgi:hypothetical protein